MSRSSRNPFWWGIWVAFAAHSCFVTVALGQRARVQWQQPPHYIGDSIVVRVTAEQFDGDTPPKCVPGPMPDGFTIFLVDVNQSRSQTIQNINGKRSIFSMVKHQYDFHLIVDRSGNDQIPPFTITQGQRTAKTKPFKLHFSDAPIDSNMRIALGIPSGPLYAGQRVPVTIEWSYAGDINHILGNRLSIRSRIFDQFRFKDEPMGQGNERLPILTARGEVRLKAEVTNRVLDGRQFVVYTAKRLMYLDQPAEHDLPAIRANVDKVKRWRRNMFGDRQPTETVRIGATGDPRQLVVESIPLADAPASFGGAVGRGFDIEVQADRSVVRVGDPIDLTITLQGDADLESVGVPSLASSGAEGGGLDPKQFRVSDVQITGTVLSGGRTKRFVVPVRVLSESVTRIPPIAYSWFEPAKGKFETTQSDPIALDVRSAQMVDAADVESGVRTPQTPDNDSAAPSVEPNKVEPPDVRAFDLTGADLAIETDSQRLLVDDRERFGGVATHAAIYIASMVLIICAWWRRRAAEVDPQLAQRRRMIETQVNQIAWASELPCREAAGQIASALRQIAPHASRNQRGQIDRLLSECDVLTYDREADNAQAIDRVLHERAVTVAKTVAKEAA